MAKPKIFLSSTYYDLKQVRADLERFIKELGYDPILNEQGSIPYGKEDKLEEYCYKEIKNVDILVSIVGGRYGSESKIEKHSISQLELKTAYELDKQVYIFIEKSVFNEYQFYLHNKENKNVKFSYADNPKIYQFIEEIEALKKNNTICGFETSSEIISFLKAQWAGLFQRFLQGQTRIKELNVIKGIENTAKTLDQLVTFLTEEKQGKDNTINEILLSNHPAMEQLKQQLEIPYRVFFTNKDELFEHLYANGFEESKDRFLSGYQTWENEIGFDKINLSFSDSLFNSENKLKVFTKEEWSQDFIKFSIEDVRNVKETENDGLPF
jgi:CRISPR/Cas system-associated exonuclease Cas4 (RecB family)